MIGATSQYRRSWFPTMVFRWFPEWASKNPIMFDQNLIMAVHSYYDLEHARNGRGIIGYIYIMYICIVFILCMRLKQNQSTCDMYIHIQYILIHTHMYTQCNSIIQYMRIHMYMCMYIYIYICIYIYMHTNCNTHTTNACTDAEVLG